MTSDRLHRLSAIGVAVAVATLGVAGLALPGTSSSMTATPAAAANTEASSALTFVGSPSRYLPINPIRVLDTRTDPLRRRLAAGGVLSIAPVTPAVSVATGVAGSAAAAVVVNVTMVGSGGQGFATVWPTGTTRPTSSVLNTNFGGETVPNMVTVQLGADGSISLFSSIDADFIVDVQGVYVATTSATAGRLVPLTPRRAIDTRATSAIGPNGTITVDLTAVGVPATASAAVLNVTATRTLDAGFYTVWPADTAIPATSNLNVPGPGATVANQVIARVTNGRINVYSWAGGDVIVDVAGYMTGTSAPAGSDGLFVPVKPDRLLDTRTPGGFSTGRPLTSGTSITLPITGQKGVPAGGVQSVALNLTATRTMAWGYVTAWPANTPTPGTSSLNFVAADLTIANHAITPLNGGAAAFSSFGGNDLLVDVTGYWTDGSAPLPGPGTGNVTLNTVSPPPTTTPPPAPATVGNYSFLYQSPPKSTAKPYGRWNACAPIVYVVNADRATSQMVDQMNLAIAAIEQATGLDFVYGGPTSAGLDLEAPPGADAVIGFSDENSTPVLAGNVIGIGGGSYSPSTGQVGRGFAFADVNDITTLDRLRATFTHEIGHLVGLDHVVDATQLMNATATSVTDLQAGDREGLWYLGAAQPCFAAGAFTTAQPAGSPVGSDTLPADAVVVSAT
jgi:hypothetical protein